ncbi:MAG: hypothetical protein WC471_00555 [Candidatus Woesearchaeota archaeon]
MNNQNKYENTFGQNVPERKFTTGAIQATVWRNNGKAKSGEAVEYRTISFDKRYKDPEGNWKSTSSLRITDLPKAIVVLNKAFEYAVLKDSLAADENAAY